MNMPTREIIKICIVCGNNCNGKHNLVEKKITIRMHIHLYIIYTSVPIYLYPYYYNMFIYDMISKRTLPCNV